MGILERQIQKKLEEATMKLLREGRVPDVRRVSMEIAEFVAKADGGPTMRPRYQPRRTQWNINDTNRVLKDVRFDLEVCFEEMIDQVGKLLSRFSLVELTYQAQRYELDALLSLLKNLAFTTKNLEDNFYGVFDTFDDLSKVDQAKTTRDAVDLNEGVVLLPATHTTGDKVNLSHLFTRQSWPISVMAPDEPLVPRDRPTGGVAPPPGAMEKPSPVVGNTPATIVQSEPIPGEWFGNAFSDMVSTWRHVVTTSNGLGCAIQFTVPLTAQNSDSVSISRIFLHPGSTVQQEVSVLHSFDGVNYVKFTGVPETVTMQTGRATTIDFETTRTRFVRFKVALPSPTTQDAQSFSYIFGFRNISFFKLGRVQEAEFVSKALTATAMNKAIDKVAISTIEDIPNNCDISWYVAPADSKGQPRNDLWRPINPVNKVPLDGIPQVVKFSESATKRIDLPAQSTYPVHETVRGVDFYRLTTTKLTDSPLVRQVFLYRGENAWWRNVQREIQTRQTRDVFVDFNSGDVQNLYIIKTETAQSSSNRTIEDQVLTTLTLSDTIDYNPATMLQIPDQNIDPEVDQRPRYAVYKVLRFRDRMTISGESVTLTGDVFATLANPGIVGSGVGRPVVTNFSTSVTYTEGIDYILEQDADTSRLTGKIKRVGSGNISSGSVVKVTYELESDVTHLVSGIGSPNKVFLTGDMGNVADQHFQVTYRVIPKNPDNEIKKATVHVTSQYGANEGETYEEGRDYLIDTARGTITRVPSGNINTSLVVFVDFRYEETPRDVDTFSTWVYVERRDPFIIEINPLTVDLEAGEMVMIDGIEINGSSVFPELAFGWHQVLVKSKRPEVFEDAAIKRMAKLTDRNGDPVFVAGGPFFSRMTANRIPLIQKDYTQLTRATGRYDHNYFAIDDDNVIVNFKPGDTEEVYLYGMRFVNGILTASTWPEQFRLEYSYPVATSEPVRAILIKAVLNRGGNTDGGLTPKIHEYHARLA